MPNPYSSHLRIKTAILSAQSLDGSINKASEYLARRYQSLARPYTVALTSYALALTGKLNNEKVLMKCSKGDVPPGDTPRVGGGSYGSPAGCWGGMGTTSCHQGWVLRARCRPRRHPLGGTQRPHLQHRGDVLCPAGPAVHGEDGADRTGGPVAVPAELLWWWLRIHAGGLRTSPALLGAALAPTAMGEWRLVGGRGGVDGFIGELGSHWGPPGTWGFPGDPSGPWGSPGDMSCLSGSTSGL